MSRPRSVWPKEAKKSALASLSTASNAVARGMRRQALVALDQALSEIALVSALELLLVDPAASYTPPISKILPTLLRHERYSKVISYLPLLIAAHELRTIAVHHPNSRIKVTHAHLCRLLEAVVHFARASGLSVPLSVLVGAIRRSRLQVLCDWNQPWGPSAYSPLTAAKLRKGLQRRRMIGGWLGGPLAWPLVECSICGSLVVPEYLTTTQDEISFSALSEPVVVYCLFGCANLHQKAFREAEKENPKAYSYMDGEYFLQPLLQLLIPSTEIPTHLY
jgi:hypothetical protein